MYPFQQKIFFAPLGPLPRFFPKNKRKKPWVAREETPPPSMFSPKNFEKEVIENLLLVRNVFVPENWVGEKKIWRKRWIALGLLYAFLPLIFLI